MQEGITEAIRRVKGIRVQSNIVLDPQPVLIPKRWFTAMTGPEQDEINNILIDDGIAAIEANGGKALLLIKAAVIHDGKW